MSTSRRAARQQRPQPQPNPTAETPAATPTQPATPATPPTAATGADECRVPDCTKPPLQGGICFRHFLEGHRG